MMPHIIRRDYKKIQITGAVAVAVVTGIIELVSPVDDNLVIPVAVSVLLALMPGDRTQIKINEGIPPISPSPL